MEAPVGVMTRLPPLTVTAKVMPDAPAVTVMALLPKVEFAPAVKSATSPTAVEVKTTVSVLAPPAAPVS